MPIYIAIFCVLPLLAGLIPEPASMTPEELIPLFSWEKIPKEDLFSPL